MAATMVSDISSKLRFPRKKPSSEARESSRSRGLRPFQGKALVRGGSAALARFSARFPKGKLQRLVGAVSKSVRASPSAACRTSWCRLTWAMAAASESIAASAPVVLMESGARRFVFFLVIFIGRVAVPSYILIAISSVGGQRKRPVHTGHKEAWTTQ